MIEAGFNILTNIFTYTYDTFKNHINDLYALFKLGIQYENNSIKVSAI